MPAERFKLHVVHVAGTRMKSWGIDGLSQGDLMEEMMAGADHLSFIPLADGADIRSNSRVSHWVHTWWGNWCGAPLVNIDHNN